jgi:urease beta subunit
MAGGFWDLDNVRLVESMPTAIAIENASFEAPAIDPNGFPALPYMDGWLEIDLDPVASSNTGVFANTPIGSSDRMVNADGKQLAFLGSQKGNALEQDLAAVYKAGCGYRLTVGAGVSARFPPSAGKPVDTIELVLYYLDGAKPVDIVHQTVEAKGLSSTQLQDFSVYLSTVQAGDAWAGKTIGVAIRAAGKAGGFWDLDNVRLAESLPIPNLALAVKE